MITLTNLSKQYNGVTALEIPELTLGDGELVGLVGNNGAGKTTMMRLMLDLIQAKSGYVTIDGKRVDQDETWKSFTGSFLDSTFLIDFYTPEEYFGFIGEVYDIPQTELQLRLQRFEALMGGEIMGTGKLIHGNRSDAVCLTVGNHRDRQDLLRGGRHFYNDIFPKDTRCNSLRG